MTVDDMKSLGDDSRMDVTNDEKSDYRNSIGKYIHMYIFVQKTINPRRPSDLLPLFVKIFRRA